MALFVLLFGMLFTLVFLTFMLFIIVAMAISVERYSVETFNTLCRDTKVTPVTGFGQANPLGSGCKIRVGQKG